MYKYRDALDRMNRKNVGNATLHTYRKASSKLVRQLTSAYRTNQRFFTAIPDNFNVIICTNEEMFKQFAREYYVPYAKALVHRNGDVVTRSQGSMRASDKQFFRILTHELNHTFWVNNGKREKYSPFWLCEGLACYAAKNAYIYSRGRVMHEIRKANIDATILHYRYLSRHLISKKRLRLLYSIWCHFVRFMDKKGDLRLLVDMQRTSLTASDFESAIHNVYGVAQKKLFTDFAGS